MKRTTILLILILFSGATYAQSLSIESKEFIKADLSGTLLGSGITISDADGTVLLNGNYNASGDDPSLKIFTLNDGSFVIRENIANFLVYDSFGVVRKSISNSTQSEGGEAISELAMDGFGKTVVVYNPKVNMNGETGSRAKIIDSKNNPLDVYYSMNRTLSVVKVSSNGEFIAFVSSKEGTDDEIQLMDRFGNILNTVKFDQEVRGVSFSENGLFVTIYSTGRAASFEVRSGERVGSSSFRSTTVMFAGYDPTDKIIIALTGSGSSTISNVQLHAVNVAARKIARKDFSASLNIVDQLKMERTGNGRYMIKGLDKELALRAQF